MRLLSLLLSLVILSSCGFHPVYGVNKYTATGVEDKLAQIRIENIPNREGQHLRNALIDRFYRDGRPSNAPYTLQISNIQERLTDLDITKNADATRGQLRLETKMWLKNEYGETLLKRELRTINSYNILANEYSTRISEENTRLNALDDLARQIEQQISLYFKRTQ